MNIPLNGAANTRDLGGIPGENGRKIRKNRLIRSGALSAITPEDARILQGIPLTDVIDLRTPAETAMRRDVIIEGVQYHALPLIEESALGVTHEKTHTQQLVRMATDPAFRAESHMQKIYRCLVATEFSAGQLKRFFELLMQPRSGAVLWHCTAGKDRVGVCTALLLTALGAEWDAILEDYLRTNDNVGEEIRRSVENLHRELGETADFAAVEEMIVTLYTVRESYLKSVFEEFAARYGSAQAYLTQSLGLTPEKIRQLKELYLEP